jgi:hypothetical protein
MAAADRTHCGQAEALQLREWLEAAQSAVQQALDSFPQEVKQSLQAAELPLVKSRDSLITCLRSMPFDERRDAISKALERVNVCLSLVLGMEYPQGSRKRPPLEQARELIQELLAGDDVGRSA